MTTPHTAEALIKKLAASLISNKLQAEVMQFIEAQAQEIATLRDERDAMKLVHQTLDERDHFMRERDGLRKVAQQALDELLSVLESINKDQIHHDGDAFHELLGSLRKELG